MQSPSRQLASLHIDRAVFHRDHVDGSVVLLDFIGVRHGQRAAEHLRPSTVTTTVEASPPRDLRYAEERQRRRQHGGNDDDVFLFMVIYALS